MVDCCLKKFDGKWGCCCKCKHQEKISKHPWNKEEFSKGSISESIGWGCTVAMMMDDTDDDCSYPKITFSDTEHGTCTVFQKKGA